MKEVFYSIWVTGNDVTIDTITVKQHLEDITATLEGQEVLEYFENNLKAE